MTVTTGRDLAAVVDLAEPLTRDPEPLRLSPAPEPADDGVDPRTQLRRERARRKLRRLHEQDARAQRQRTAREAKRASRISQRGAARRRSREGLLASGRWLRGGGLPLLLVTGYAGFSQFHWAMTVLAPQAFGPLLVRVAVSLTEAAAVEAMSLTVQWHAHDALVDKASATAARLRRASYLIAAVVGSVNYSHFADPGGRPTAAAVVALLCSLVSPWLWGLHTRRTQRLQLKREGLDDVAGAVFSAQRFRTFPIRTIGARRWSIDNWEVDPQKAWDGYRAECERLARLRLRRRIRSFRRIRSIRLFRYLRPFRPPLDVDEHDDQAAPPDAWWRDLPALAGERQLVLGGVEFIWHARREGQPHGQRPVARHLGCSRDRAGDVIAAATDHLDGPDGPFIVAALEQRHQVRSTSAPISGD